MRLPEACHQANVAGLEILTREKPKSVKAVLLVAPTKEEVFARLHALWIQVPLADRDEQRGREARAFNILLEACMPRDFDDQDVFIKELIAYVDQQGE